MCSGATVRPKKNPDASGRYCSRPAKKANCRSRISASSSSTGAYEYLRFDSRKNEWQPIEDDELFAQRELPEGLRFRLRLESREVVLKPNLPQRGDKDENKKNPPHIMVLSSGDVSPFELEIEREGQPGVVAA